MRGHARLSRGQPFPLGATPTAGGTNFAVSSEVADAVEVCLFDDGTGAARVELPSRTAHVWHGFLPDVGPGPALRAAGPRARGIRPNGLRCNPAKLLLDPHATAIDGEVTWDEAVFGHTFDDPTGATTPTRPPFMPRCVVTDRGFDWEGDAPPRVALDETVIYETHVKGLTHAPPRRARGGARHLCRAGPPGRRPAT